MPKVSGSATGNRTRVLRLRISVLYLCHQSVPLPVWRIVPQTVPQICARIPLGIRAIHSDIKTGTSGSCEALLNIPVAMFPARQTCGKQSNGAADSRCDF